MSKTATYDDLLTVCIQDLHGGAVLLRDLLPDIMPHANRPALAVALARVAGEAENAAVALAATGRHEGGAKNLWMSGIADDARRDTKSIEPGPLLDAAIVGAIRKALAAQIVSYDTAIAVAAALDEGATRGRIEDIRSAAIASNNALAVFLPKAA